MNKIARLTHSIDRRNKSLASHRAAESRLLEVWLDFGETVIRMAPVASTASNVCYFRVNFKSVYATPIMQPKFTEYDVIRSYWGKLYRKSSYFIIVLSLVCRTDRSIVTGNGWVVVRSWGREEEWGLLTDRHRGSCRGWKYNGIR